MRHSLGQRLAMSTAAGSVMPQSQLRLLYLFLERHVHELEGEQDCPQAEPSAPSPLPFWHAGISPGLLFAAGAVWTGDQEGCIQVRAKQQARPCSISSCLSHRCQKIKAETLNLLRSN